jgi:hypothetical protein
MIMLRMTSAIAGLALIVLASGCAGMGKGEGAIMQEAMGDPAGSASIGTGSVTVNSMIAPEAWSAGIGLAP